MDLSPDQLRVHDAVLAWLKAPYERLLTLGGLGGTGKTTVLGELAHHFPTPTAYVAPTGRASSVMARKLVEGGTRITTLQRPPEGKKLSRKWRHLFDESLTENGGPPLCTTLHQLLLRPIIDSKTEELLGWQPRTTLDRRYKLIVVDEASQVGNRMLETLVAQGVLVLAVGDHWQLPPVQDSGSLMQNPMLRLEQIHRQAEGSSIIALARHVREGGRLKDFTGWNADCVLRSRSEEEAVVRETLAEPNRLDVTLIAWTNKTRVRLNRIARRLQGYEGPNDADPRLPPVVGEPIVALHNYTPICNGMRGLLAQPSFLDERRSWILHGNVEFPDDMMAGDWHEMNGCQFNRQKPFASVDELRAVGIPAETMGGGGRLFDFGYCLTAHKCVDPDTLVETPGGLSRAGDLRSGGLVATPNGHAEYHGLVRNGSSNMLEIETIDGYSLRVTTDHGVDVWNSDVGYERREASAISPGDILRLRLGYEFGTGGDLSLPSGRPQDVRARKYVLPSRCTPSVAEFFGLMAADGTVYSKGFRLAKRHEDVADRFEFLCRDLFGAKPSRFFKLGAHYVEVSSALIADWLRDVGGLSPNKKGVPAAVLSSNVYTQARFLRGLFEDATVNVASNGMLDHIEFVSVFPQLRRDVRTMLLRFGIICGRTPGRQESVYVYGQYAYRFSQMIGFISAFKAGRILDAKIPSGTRYQIPLLRTETHLVPQSGRPFVQRHRVPVGDCVDRMAFHHSEVGTVRSYLGASVCVSVPDGHQFLQDGFCGWNSQGSQFDHVVVTYERNGVSDEEKRWNYTALSRASKRLTVLA